MALLAAPGTRIRRWAFDHMTHMTHFVDLIDAIFSPFPSCMDLGTSCSAPDLRNNLATCMGCCGEAKCTCHNSQCVDTSEKQGVLGDPLCGFVGCRKSHLPRSAVSVAQKSAHPPPARITAVAPVPYPHNALPWLYATGFACRSTCREATYRRHGRLARSLGFVVLVCPHESSIPC